MKRLLLTVLALLFCTGCTTTALKRRTINQSLSLSDAQYQEIMDNLAIVAANPGTIPSFATFSSGLVNVTNTYGFDPTTKWSNTNFTNQALNLAGKHTPDQQWTIAPVAECYAL